MINFSKNKRILIIIFAVLLLSGSVIIAADPGSADDPIITLSYFKEQTEIFKKEITGTISALEKKIPKSASTEDAPLASSFKVVNLKATESLTCGEGTELIVRSGQSKAIASEAGGLSDVTEGRDISNGEIIKNNHHLIVPRNDGRGIVAMTDGAIMIKGAYEKK